GRKARRDRRSQGQPWQNSGVVNGETVHQPDRRRKRARRCIVGAWATAYTAAMSTEPAGAAPPAPATDADAECPRCRKPPALCVCEGITPIDNKVALLILQ